MTTEEMIRKYNPIININNNYVANVAGLMDLQKIIEDYVLRLQTWVDTGKIKAATCGNYLPPVKLFCEMNDIILNWKKIHRLLPRSDGNAADESYDRHMIQKMLRHSDLRTKIPILFMASGGMRLGGFANLRQELEQQQKQKQEVETHPKIDTELNISYNNPIQEAQQEQIDQEKEELKKEVEGLNKSVQQLKQELSGPKDLTKVGPGQQKVKIPANEIIKVLISRAMKMRKEYLELSIENGIAKLPRINV